MMNINISINRKCLPQDQSFQALVMVYERMALEQDKGVMMEVLVVGKNS